MKAMTVPYYFNGEIQGQITVPINQVTYMVFDVSYDKPVLFIGRTHYDINLETYEQLKLELENAT